MVVAYLHFNDLMIFSRRPTRRRYIIITICYNLNMIRARPLESAHQYTCSFAPRKRYKQFFLGMNNLNVHQALGPRCLQLLNGRIAAQFNTCVSPVRLLEFQIHDYANDSFDNYFLDVYDVPAVLPIIFIWGGINVSAVSSRSRFLNKVVFLCYLLENICSIVCKMFWHSCCTYNNFVLESGGNVSNFLFIFD